MKPGERRPTRPACAESTSQSTQSVEWPFRRSSAATSMAQPSRAALISCSSGPVRLSATITRVMRSGILSSMCSKSAPTDVCQSKSCQPTACSTRPLAAPPPASPPRRRAIAASSAGFHSGDEAASGASAGVYTAQTACCFGQPDTLMRVSLPCLRRVTSMGVVIAAKAQTGGAMLTKCSQTRRNRTTRAGTVPRCRGGYPLQTVNFWPPDATGRHNAG